MPPKVERRYLDFAASKIELRDISGVDQKQLVGYAAVFNSLSLPVSDGKGKRFREILQPGCFRDVLGTADLETCALFNHNPDNLLGRFPNSVRMQEDDHGLYCEIDLPDTQCARDVQANIRAGNISQMSFGFVPAEWRDEKIEGQDVRRVTRVGLLADISPVTYPAYRSTFIMSRAENPESVDDDLDGPIIYRAESKIILPESESAKDPEEETGESLELRKLKTRILKLKN